MKRTKRKILKANRIILLISFILIFNILGVGYAAWSQNIYVNNTIQTGNFDVLFVPSSKANCKDAINVINEDGKTLDITLNNVIPDNIYNIPFTIKNNGTLYAAGKPLKIEKKNFAGELTVSQTLQGEFAAGQTFDGTINITSKNINAGETYNPTCTMIFNCNAWGDDLKINIAINAAKEFPLDKKADDKNALENNCQSDNSAGESKSAGTELQAPSPGPPVTPVPTDAPASAPVDSVVLESAGTIVQLPADSSSTAASENK